MNYDLFVYISLPLIAALIGWITNFFAVKMIFHPRKPIFFLGLRIQGLVPKRQAELAQSIAETIEKELISHRDIQAVLQSPEVKQEISQAIGRELDTFMEKKLTSHPILSMFMQGEMIVSMKHMLVEQIDLSVPNLLENLVLRIERDLHFREIVQEKILSFDVSKLEDIVLRISSRELKLIEVLGGVLGFIVGLLQVAFMALPKYLAQ